MVRRSQHNLAGWYLPLQKVPLAENRFLQAQEVKELKIQRKKSRQ
jgi:hypothetical protein